MNATEKIIKLIPNIEAVLDIKKIVYELKKQTDNILFKNLSPEIRKMIDEQNPIQ